MKIRVYTRRKTFTHIKQVVFSFTSSFIFSKDISCYNVRLELVLFSNHLYIYAALCQKQTNLCWQINILT